VIKIVSEKTHLEAIINKSFLRSHGKISNKSYNIYCFISPSIEDEKLINELILNNSKILILGQISKKLAHLIGLKCNNKKMNLREISFNHSNKEDRSNLYIKYKEHELNKNNPLNKRYFHRFDFTNEWNNLGYGAIKNDESIWSLSQPLEAVNTQVIAEVYDNDEKVSVFSCVKNFENSSVLYVNREVSLVDGLDTVLIEDFLSTYRSFELPSLPKISDIPYGFEAVVSARLDCDQSILNSKSLVELYKKYDINLSLAIATGIEISEEAIKFLNQFYNKGGGILSHTINHYEFWGDCYNTAFSEANGSKQWLEENITNLNNLKYSVSPFHSNKPYSVQALKDSEYEGFISGIIHNDPEYLVATSGPVPFVDGDIVTHSQQCMLHGDCYHRRGNSIEIEKQSFKNYYNSKKLFGYLDHPFGDYDYGWKSEEERLSVHEEFINYINSFDNVKWMTCTEILDFVVDKSNLEILIDENNELVLKRTSHNSKEKIKVLYKNKEYIC
jgi:hypothetical protein